MRVLLALVLLAAAGGVAFLLFEGDGPGKGSADRERNRAEGRDEPATDNGPARVEPLPDVLAAATRDPFAKTTQAELARFVAACKARGEEAVPLLAELLREGKDVKLQPRWFFRKRTLVGYPTVRSAFLTALASIPGEHAGLALHEALRTARVWEEAYLAGIALHARDAQGWVDDMLDQTLGQALPAQMTLQQDAIALAAESDAESLARRLAQAIPRGKDAEGDGRILSEAARTLPVELAVSTATPLITDPGVNYRARANLIRALMGRPEVEVYERMRETALSTRLDEELSRAIAWAAVNNPQFATEAINYAHALSSGDTATADAIQRRFDARKRAAAELVNAALDLDLQTSDDVRAKAMRRALNAHRLKADGPR